MLVELEIDDDYSDKIVRNSLITAFETYEDVDWYNPEDIKYYKKLRKAMLRVIEHYSKPSDWKEFKEKYND